jgi:hypothetical protein
MDKMKNIIRLLLATILFASILLCDGCSAQKKHKAIPCPCEKQHKNK